MMAPVMACPPAPPHPPTFLPSLPRPAPPRPPLQAVNVVINFDFPKNSETYLHRVSMSLAGAPWQ